MNNRIPDWTTVWKLERDICYLYHELAEYPSIVGDLAYGSIYTLPYWDYLPLDVESMRLEEKSFVEAGCLVFILCMAMDVIEGSGSYIKPNVDRCHQALERMQRASPDLARLVAVVLASLDAAEKGVRQISPQLEAECLWVNETYVRGYFRQMAGSR